MRAIEGSEGDDGASGRPPSRDTLYWAVALGGFALAMLVSWGTARQPQSPDLRTPAVLLLNAALATAIALGYAADRGALASRGGATWCVLFGAWSAAAFRLVPPAFDFVLFRSGGGTFGPNWPGALVIIGIGAVIHGGIALLMAWPYARRVVGVEGRALWAEDDPVLRLSATTFLVFYILAAIFRAVAGFRE